MKPAYSASQTSTAPLTASSSPSSAVGGLPLHSTSQSLGRKWDFWLVRFALVGATVLLCYTLSPFGFRGLPAAGLGFLVAMVILLAELRLRRVEISGLMGGAVGAVIGLLSALLITLVISRTAEPEPTKSFFEFTSLFAFGYLGLVLGSRKGLELRHLSLPGSVKIAAPSSVSLKLLDT